MVDFKNGSYDDKEDVEIRIEMIKYNIETEKRHLSYAMDSSLDDDLRLSALEDAYLSHLVAIRDARLFGKVQYDKHLKGIFNKEHEEMNVLDFEAYIDQ